MVLAGKEKVLDSDVFFELTILTRIKLKISVELACLFVVQIMSTGQNQIRRNEHRGSLTKRLVYGTSENKGSQTSVQYWRHILLVDFLKAVLSKGSLAVVAFCEGVEIRLAQLGGDGSRERLSQVGSCFAAAHFVIIIILLLQKSSISTGK